ncbi:T9SS type A sorting domain-containing protein [Owenweeksia hongkongensis]|uniref:T9SS type A sorting domain-containing protein n=1 Tax=Owenweeksia hongkongensis TaxID=253245 RepID=UPI003A9388EC
MKKLTLLTLLALFSSLVLAQAEQIFHQPEDPVLRDMRIIKGQVFFSVSYIQPGSVPNISYLIKGDLEMTSRDSLRLTIIAPDKRFLSISEPIGDTLFCVLMTKVKNAPPYEHELLFVDTSLQVSSRKILPPTNALLYSVEVVGDSLIYFFGGDYFAGKDLYFGKFSIEGNLIKDTIYQSYIHDFDEIVELENGNLLLTKGEYRMLLDGQTLELDTIQGFGSSFVHKILAHPNGSFYATGWIPPTGWPMEIGIYVNKTDSTGNIIDSLAITNFNGFDVQTHYEEGCVLQSGDLLLPFRWDSIQYPYEIPCLKFMFVDENLQLKKTITRFFNRNIWVVNSVATYDGGAVILGRIEDTLNGGYDTYYLYMDSLGNFSPLTIFDTDAPNQGQLSLYPNPADDVIFIKGLDDQAIIDVFVTDISGAVVEKKELTYPFRMETNDLVSGVYSLLVADKRGNSFTLKMIKN